MSQDISSGPFPAPPESLRSAGLADAERAARTLAQIAGRGDDRAAFAAVLPHVLETLRSVSDPEMALNNLERFTAASLSRTFLFSLFRESPKVPQLLLTILGSSQFLADLLIRHPQLLSWLLEPGLLRRPKGRRALDEELRAMLRPAATPARRWQTLRVFKARETLRIGIQDLLGNLDLAGVTEELAHLAEVVLDAALGLCWEELVRRHGQPRHPAGPEPEPEPGDGPMAPTRFAIIGMGKLGGAELNFSSDIDLLFVYTAEGETAGISGPGGEVLGRLPNAEFFRKLGELLGKGVGEITPDGHLFRVDMRLRPGGRAGGLVASLRASEVYYEAYGQTWERQALIKARPVAGDADLGRAFLAMVVPFVYRQHLDHAAVAEIAAMRDRIALNVAADRRGERNVKLGPGGIRDIEFVVQAFQLVYGGRAPWVREPNTLRALHRIAEAGLLPRGDYAALVEAYTFLRTLEHRIQILHQVQTHVVPEDPRALRALARRMGYRQGEDAPGRGAGEDEGEQLLRDFRRHAAAVRRISSEILAPPAEGQEEAAADPLALFFETDLPPEAVAEPLAAAGVREPGRAARHLLDLREGPPLQNVAPRSRRALGRLAPALLRALGAAPDPDMALQNFERFVNAAPARDTVLELLAADFALLERLVRLFGTSEFLAASFARYPECLEMLADPEAVTRPRTRGELAAGLREALRRAAGAAAWDPLRRFKRMEEVRAGLRDVWGEADQAATARTLTALAEACVAAATELAAEDLAPRLGTPDPAGFCVVGLGKLGAGELAYGSDLDLVFVYRADGHTRGAVAGGVAHREFFSRLADRIMKTLNTITPEGAAYRVDARLRPGGSKGELAHSLEAVARHFAGAAEVWERMAYLRARPVAGDEATGRAFLRTLHAALFVPPPADLAVRAHAMRQRIAAERAARAGVHLKLGAGGTVDVEFLVQHLQLQHGHAHPGLRTQDLMEALGAAAVAGLVPPAEAGVVAEAYRFLRRVEGRLRIVLDRSVEVLPEDPAELDRLARRLGYTGANAAEHLEKDLAGHMATIRDAYRRTLGVA
jgi:glutamate-ammonia-ligase adenylyltransferase